jgi:6-phosphogluconolactonase/glucosamine-6-phosphate isomerase/deaminase
MVGITAGSLISHYEAKADLQRRAAEEFSKQSQSYVAQTVSLSGGHTTLGTCP